MNNEIIEASAGTGKTQALAERLIALIEAGVEPSAIIALTFSRMAAGEIFERFVTLLAEKAENGVEGDGTEATKRKYAALLRKTIATQNLSQIGTLDSFLLRILQAFPLEFGLMGEIRIMDDDRCGRERGALSFSLLRRTDERLRKEFVDAFSLAMNHEDVRSYIDTYRDFIGEWHELYCDNPSADAWGERRAIWGERCAFLDFDRATREAAIEAVANLKDDSKWNDFIGWLRDEKRKFSKPGGYAEKMLSLPDLLTTETIEFTFSRKTIAFGKQETAMIQAAFFAIFAAKLNRILERTKGVHRLVAAFEREYDRKVRRKGNLVFSDVPRLIAGLGPDERLALEYRMDAKIKAWALDEFQDTSREQWKALGNLINEAKQSDGEKTLFVVGDRKQAIYGWRHGDVGIFANEQQSGAYERKKLARTYRSGKAIVDAVNRLFVHGPVNRDFPDWVAPEHETARPELKGWVQVTEAFGAKEEDFIEPVMTALKAVDPVRHGLTAAVLVRSNRFGEKLAAGLKAKGFTDVVWEGESRVLDTVALSGFLDLVQLAEHPGDMLAWRHFKMTELARRKYPAGVPEAAEVSRDMSLLFTVRGLARALRELRALLPEDPSEAWSEFTESRFIEMLRAASDFELEREASTRLSDFAGFLESRTKRSLAEPGKVKIMTIHRSKGLGFDYVVLPLYEPKGLSRNPEGPIVDEGKFVLPFPGKEIASRIPVLSEVYRRNQSGEELESVANYYVAMTRAKRAMTIVLPPAPKKALARKFSGYVREALGLGVASGEDIELFAESPKDEGDGGETQPLSPPERTERVRLRRRLPSKTFVSGMSAGDLFAPKFRSRDAAKKRGEEMHRLFEAIEWIDPSALKNELEAEIIAKPEWREAFVRPEGMKELWRERSYELYSAGAWESGVIDRAVFTEGGAEVYDFKTNRRRAGESDEDFRQRLNVSYAAQLESYRRAVNALTGIPLERIRAKLLVLE